MRQLYRSYRVFCAQNQTHTFNRTIRFNSSTTTSTEKIVIPKRIHRGPTDILYALSATIGTDPTAAHYKYHDDPFLIPQSNSNKRSFALAQEAGRKAAKWIKEEHSKLFQHKHADPPIPAFAPATIYNDDSEVSESSLEQLIANAQVSDAILVYNLMVKRDINISDELRQSFLELLCFNNQEDNIPEELIEERWFSLSNVGGRERPRKTWKDGELAELIFEESKPKSSAAYNAIIRGMCKYLQVERGYALYQEALQKDLHIDVATFNAVIRVTHFLRQSGDTRWQFVMEILQTMASRKVKPNLETMNAVLSVLSTMSGMVAREYVLQVLAECKALGIVPSLETWYFVLCTHCRNNGPISHVLVDIINEIEGKEFKIQGLKDTFFFVTAMDVCRYHLNDKDLARRIDDLLHVGSNYDLIGDSYRESIYYRHFLSLLCNTEPLEEFMKTYNALVPNIYTPELSVMMDILKQVEINGTLDLIPRLWSDIVIFEHTNRDNILEVVLKVMADNKPSDEIPAHVGLNSKFADIAWQIFTKMEEQQSNKSNRLNWTATMISNTLTVICRNDDYEKAFQVFEKLNEYQDEIYGAMNPNSLHLFVQLCISNKQPSRAIAALQYCVENSFPNNQALGQLIVKSMTLGDHHISKITSLVGTDVLKSRE